jgi:putative DNA primase/helicase
LTGGDRVRARRLYENSYEFDPCFKLWLATNHKPNIKGTDPAIWSRLKLVPFDVSFEGREDRSLKADLLKELPGILAWAVKGCGYWQAAGLEFPESVKQATREYRSESDQVGRFLEETCVFGTYLTARARSLYGAYRQWAEETGETVLSEKAFAMRLKQRGLQSDHERTGALYKGVGLRSER